MQRQQVYAEIKAYLAEKFLEDEGAALGEYTPLLEWGLLSSLDIIKLLSFIEKQYQLQIPLEMITAEHFVNLAAITDMIVKTLEIARAV